MLIINPAQSWLTIAKGYTKRIIDGHKSVQLGGSTSPNNAPVRDMVLHFKFFKSRVVERKGECVRLARVGLKI